MGSCFRINLGLNCRVQGNALDDVVFTHYQSSMDCVAVRTGAPHTDLCFKHFFAELDFRSGSRHTSIGITLGDVSGIGFTMANFSRAIRSYGQPPSG
jgi:hypothetical protein